MTYFSSRHANTTTGLFVLAILLVLDRVLKMLALAGVTAQGGPMAFLLFRNEGLVFSLPIHTSVGTGLVTVATVVVMVLIIRTWRRHWRLDLGLGLMFIGAASNLFDRFRYGFVIDWAYLGAWWPVFNLADVLVAVGLVLYLRRQVR